jgi:hypothetical protein
MTIVPLHGTRLPGHQSFPLMTYGRNEIHDFVKKSIHSAFDAQVHQASG